MAPKLILHNTVSLDGSIAGFEVDIGLHYQVLGTMGAQAALVGSRTARSGLEMFGPVPAEEPGDFARPDWKARADRPLWFIPDSRGSLRGKLHALRRSEFCRDVVVLVSRATPATYLRYLRERDYAHHVVGADRVDLRRALALVGRIYRVKTIVTDCGPSLAGALLDAGLVDEASLVIAPAWAGRAAVPLFGTAAKPGKLVLLEQTALGRGALRVRYRVK